jgi:hypothetical protein
VPSERVFLAMRAPYGASLDRRAREARVITAQNLPGLAAAVGQRFSSVRIVRMGGEATTSPRSPGLSHPCSKWLEAERHSWLIFAARMKSF